MARKRGLNLTKDNRKWTEKFLDTYKVADTPQLTPPPWIKFEPTKPKVKKSNA